MSKFNITYDQLHDFIQCPLIYKFKYIEKIKKDKNYIRNKVQKILIETIKEFYRVIQKEKRTMTFKELKTFWSSLYYKDSDISEVLFRSNDSKQKQINKAKKFLLNFHNRYSDNPGVTIDINIPFNIKLPKIIISGEIPIVREINGNIDILFLDYRKYNPDKFRGKNYMFFSLISYAYQNIFKEKEDSITYYNASYDKIVKVSRSENDYKKAFNQINNISVIIDNELFYQHYDFECQGCPYQQECTEWDGT
ncbi:MAG: hypothetical protein ACOCRK_05465 [bacterium]